MKNLITICLLSLSLIACSTEQVDFTQQGTSGKDGVNGTNGANGVDGQDGVDGVNGKDGLNSIFSISNLESEQEICYSGSGIMISSGLDADKDNVLDPEEINPVSVAFLCNGAPGPQGPQGVAGPAGADGEDGANGTNGTNGSNGSDGQSCTLQDTEEGALVTCGGTQTTIYDGQNGQDGQDGEDGTDANAVLTSYTLTNSCQNVGNGFYAKKFGSNAKIYDDNDCGNDDLVASLVENSDEVFMTSNIMFVVEEGPSSVKLYKVVF